MAQAEVLQLVATAVDRASPVLLQVQKSLDQLRVSAVGLGASMAQSDATVRAYGDAFRGASTGMRAFQVAQRAAAAASQDLQGQMSRFAGTLGREVASAITRVQSALVSTTLSVVAFKNQLQTAKELNEFIKATGFARDTMRGLTEAGQELGLTGDQVQKLMGQLSQSFQGIKYLGGSNFWKQLLNIPEGRDAAQELEAISQQIQRKAISAEAGAEQQFRVFLRFVRQYREAYGAGLTRTMLTEKLGISADWENLARVGAPELLAMIEKFAAEVHELDPDQVDKFWRAWRSLNRELSNFTTDVLNPLLPKLNEFINIFASPAIKKFTDEVGPKLATDLGTTFDLLIEQLEGKTLDWEKFFSMNVVTFLKDDFADFKNQLTRAYQQLRTGLGIGSQAELDAARKEELQFRVDKGKASEQEKKELGDLKQGKPEVVEGTKIPRVSSEQEKEIVRRLEEHRKNQMQGGATQPQRFTDSQVNPLGLTEFEGPRSSVYDLSGGFSENVEDRRGLGGVGQRVEVQRSENDNTNATRDLTEEVRKLNENFLRGLGASLPGGGTAVRFAPSDGDLRTGTGPGGGPPGGAITGGGPPGGGGGSRRGPAAPPTPVIPPQPVPVFPRGESKAAGKHIGTAPDATMPAPETEVPVYGPGESKAAGKRLGTAPDATMPASAGAPEGAVYGPQDRSNLKIPASIRYNNPGAQAFANTARIWGGEPGTTGTGHSIAGFPTPVHGLASNIDLLNRRYVGRTISDAMWEWSGHSRRTVGSNVGDYPPNMILTKEMAEDPKFWSAMAGVESGRKGGLSPAQVQQALDMYKTGSAGAYEKANPDFVTANKGRPATTAAQPATPPSADGGAASVSPVTGTFARGEGNIYGAGRSGGRRRHSGVDWGADNDSDAVAMQDGTVLYNGNNSGYGANVVIQHADGTITRYATHASTANLRSGDKVKQGQVIGKVGEGHVHIEHIPPTINGKPNPVYDEFVRNAKTNSFTPTSQQRGTVDPRQYTGLQHGTKVTAGQPLTPGGAPAVADRSAPPDPYYERRKAKAAPTIADDDKPLDKAAGKNLGPKTASVDDQPDAGPKTDGDLDGLQAGGRARGRQPYVIGERGPELFMPFQSGMVLPHTALNYLKGLQVGGRSLGEYFDMAQSPQRLLSGVLGGGGNPLSKMLSGFGGGGDGNPLSQIMSGFGGGGGNPLSGLLGFQEGGVIADYGDASSLRGSIEGYDPGSLAAARRQAHKIEATGSLDVNIGSTGTAALAKSEKSGLFENINMNRNLAEQHASQRM